jgi:hypothetical protein
MQRPGAPEGFPAANNLEKEGKNGIISNINMGNVELQMIM